MNAVSLLKGKKFFTNTFEKFVKKFFSLERLVQEEVSRKLDKYEKVREHVFRGLPEEEYTNTTNFQRFHMRHGVLRSTSKMSREDKFDADQFFQYKEKAECALCPASIWGGGDYMEFGSTDMNTMRNFLTAFDIFNLESRFPDTRFYGFDIFGKTEASEKVNDILDKAVGYRNYINLFSERGDCLAQDRKIIEDHGLSVDKVRLIQGYFEETLTDSLKKDYLNEGRRVGFAFLDCNLHMPYKLVFEFLVGLMGSSSFIYMDEYYYWPVIQYFDQFTAELRKHHDMDTKLIRNAAGFGALFYVYQIRPGLPPLEFERL